MATPKTFSTLDPRVVRRSMCGLTERRLEGAVAEAAKARKDYLLFGGGWATVNRESLNEGDRHHIRLETRHGSDDDVCHRADVIPAKRHIR